MKIRIPLLIVLFVLISIVQINFFSFFSFGYAFSIPLVVITYFGMIGNNKNETRWYALLIGFTLDCFSPYAFGLHMVSMLIACIVADYLFSTFFTNRSIYVFLLLTVVATAVQGICWYGGAWGLSLLVEGLRVPSLSLLTPYRFLGNSMVAFLTFYCAMAFFRIFQKYFLSRRRVATI